MGLLDIFFPKRCVGCRRAGEYICVNCFADISFDSAMVCTECNKPSIDGKTHPVCKTKYSLDGTFAAVVYKKIVRKLIYQLKYQPYLTDLLPSLGEICYESLIQNELFANILKQKPILVPIPLTSSRLRKRGYNQAEFLAKEVGKRFGLEVHSLLKRVKETKPQYGLKREERMKNMSNAFALIESHHPHPSPLPKGEGNHGAVILIDDVLTTGSTMSEAAKILKKNGVKEVWGVALAKD